MNKDLFLKLLNNTKDLPFTKEYDIEIHEYLWDRLYEYIQLERLKVEVK